MAHAENRVTIERPVSAVFDFVLDGANNALWRPAVISIERSPESPSGTGAIYKQKLKGPGGARLMATMRSSSVSRMS
jgi:hypothetical protein